ncbi:MAG: hypothetical protein J2P48_20120 [Alphaproteobacteria bacterium]|nr:hypothetical protein [Alphaproteobacteria bacterium]
MKFLAGTEHDIEIRDMNDPDVIVAASGYGVRRLPAVVIDGKLADRGAGRGPDEDTLTEAILTGRGFTPTSAEDRLRARRRTIH